MKKIKFLVPVLGLVYNINFAQVDDISLTISPAAEYTQWDNKAGLEDGFLFGGKLGFGFGEYMELRAIYMQSQDLKTNFDEFNLPNFDASTFAPQDVKLTRWGGEFKANIGTKKLNPYLTVGSGVQKLELDGSDDLEQIYASLGLGIKFNITPRAVFSLEAKNTTYNFNAGSSLLTDQDKTTYGVTDADFSRDRLYNWGIQGSLQFYLGGRKPGDLTALDKAYLDKFKGGLKGLQLIIEPSLAHISFNDNSLYRDTYLLGGYAGFDFNEYIGLRGFYFQTTENDEISTKFDRMAMYGMEFRARLNDGNGVTPYLMLGGGYLNAYDDYLGKNGVNVESSEFATGGLGLNIPLGKRLLVTGGVRAMLTSGADITDVTATDDLQTHLMYNVGLKLSLGKKSAAPKDVYQDELSKELALQQNANNNKLTELKSSYQNKIDALENDLKNAYEENNVEKAVEILEDKKKAEEALEKVEIIDDVNKTNAIAPIAPVKAKTEMAPAAKPVETVNEEMLQMTPTEFENLIERILNKMDNGQEAIKTEQILEDSRQNEIDVLQKRIDRLEKLLLATKANANSTDATQLQQAQAEYQYDKLADLSEQIIKELNALSRDIDSNTRRIENMNQQPTVTIVETPVIESELEAATPIVEEAEIVEEEVDLEDELLVDKPASMTYVKTSAFIGANIGGATTANLGVRLHYDITNSPLKFMPEAFLGFGESTTFGASGNIVYPISLKSDKVGPYVGAGLGLGKIADKSLGFYNVIIGSNLPFLNENLYVDYTMRNTFDYNQIVVGYKLKF